MRGSSVHSKSCAHQAAIQTVQQLFPSVSILCLSYKWSQSSNWCFWRGTSLFSWMFSLRWWGHWRLVSIAHPKENLIWRASLVSLPLFFQRPSFSSFSWLWCSYKQQTRIDGRCTWRGSTRGTERWLHWIHQHLLLKRRMCKLPSPWSLYSPQARS